MLHQSAKFWHLFTIIINNVTFLRHLVGPSNQPVSRRRVWTDRELAPRSPAWVRPSNTPYNPAPAPASSLSSPRYPAVRRILDLQRSQKRCQFGRDGHLELQSSSFQSLQDVSVIRQKYLDLNTARFILSGSDSTVPCILRYLIINLSHRRYNTAHMTPDVTRCF